MQYLFLALVGCGPSEMDGDGDSGGFGDNGADSGADSGDSGDSGAADSGDTGDSGSGDSGGGDSGSDVHPNWTDDIAPIVYTQCVACHREGGIGPFRLDTYADVVVESNQALLAMQDRTMPPFLVDNSGECRSYDQARWLSDADIAVFEAWILLGMPEGDGELPALPDAEHLATVTSTLDVGGDYTPTLSTGDAYRCFRVDWEFSGTTFLTAYTTTPGDASIVHHTTLYSLNDPDEVAVMDELDAADEGLGWDCNDGPIVRDTNLVAVWNPGTGVTELPGNSGILVNGDLPGVLRIHYSGYTDDHVDHTTMELTTADEVERWGFLLGFDDRHIDLEPGQEAETEQSDYSPRDFGVNFDTYFWGVNPHMHNRGYAMDLYRNPDDGDECVERLLYWDYGWQQMFWYDEPLAVAPDDVFRLTCTYDTRGEDHTIRYGQTATSEMCLTIVYATIQ